MVEIDTDAVRRVGNSLYPALADKYAAAAALLTEDVPYHDIAEAWNAYREQIRLYLTTSETHLGDCGDVLVKLADDYDATETENAYNIAYPYESTFQNESD
ncbi:hypothetical protein [Phytomonospora endophytica]|uniref:Uncharacterized protein n=1 Tax=Phytomonospora endophytica TaxID=714109 RepID=A0A841FPH1_9ACTN|nr:hypothetical protein [Phytomonospora endophytica]MBB6037996.1 hypothetical protein [Phytomonospora endophytica]GIG68895.1 hypothetical protein Pen01_51900 [Phytomonospora endophytica]